MKQVKRLIPQDHRRQLHLQSQERQPYRIGHCLVSIPQQGVECKALVTQSGGLPVHAVQSHVSTVLQVQPANIQAL
jgi:hypothetical protein